MDTSEQSDTIGNPCMHYLSHVRSPRTPFSRYNISPLPSEYWDSSARLEWAVLSVVDRWDLAGSIDQDIGDGDGL